MLMSTPWRKLWEWCSVNAPAASSIVVTGSAMSYWMGRRHAGLVQDLANERELREHQVAIERGKVVRERELRESEVRALQLQLKMQQETAKKTVDDAVQSRLFQIQNAQEYAGRSISKHPAPSSG